MLRAPAGAQALDSADITHQGDQSQQDHGSVPRPFSCQGEAPSHDYRSDWYRTRNSSTTSRIASSDATATAVASLRPVPNRLRHSCTAASAQSTRGTRSCWHRSQPPHGGRWPKMPAIRCRTSIPESSAEHRMCSGNRAALLRRAAPAQVRSPPSTKPTICGCRRSVEVPRPPVTRRRSTAPPARLLVIVDRFDISAKLTCSHEPHGTPTAGWPSRRRLQTTPATRRGALRSARARHAGHQHRHGGKPIRRPDR